MNIDISGIPVNILGLISLGCISGFLSGFFGIGGGPLITPVLNILFGIPFPICIGSTLSRTAGTTFSAVLRYWKFGNIDAKLALMIVGGNFVGIEIGVYLLDWLDKLGEISVGKQSIPALQFYLQWLFFRGAYHGFRVDSHRIADSQREKQLQTATRLTSISPHPTLRFLSHHRCSPNLTSGNCILSTHYRYFHRIARGSAAASSSCRY